MAAIFFYIFLPAFPTITLMTDHLIASDLNYFRLTSSEICHLLIVIVNIVYFHFGDATYKIHWNNLNKSFRFMSYHKHKPVRVQRAQSLVFLRLLQIENEQHILHVQLHGRPQTSRQSIFRRIILTTPYLCRKL